MDAAFSRSGRLRGILSVPGDKSISHRAAIVAGLAEGRSTICGCATGTDCQSTLTVLKGLGVGVAARGRSLEINGVGAEGFARPSGPLDCGNSGTTMRLIAGAVAAFPITVTLTGDASLLGRPMTRVIEPLRLMGARVSSGSEGGRPPLEIEGGSLSGIDYSPRVASAQVKSAVLLAGLGAGGSTTVREVEATRDHTERVLELAGVPVVREGLAVTVGRGAPRGFTMEVPGDFSSAAFFIAGALMRPGSELTVQSVGLNPTRTAFLDIVKRMGADVEWTVRNPGIPGEPVGDITVRYGELKGIELSPSDVARSIDEVTLVALLATSARGRTIIRGAGELRMKESDRIRGTVEGLAAMGARVEETPDGMSIEGPACLSGARVSSKRDHRLAMLFALAGMSAGGETVVEGWEWTAVSYPEFADELARLAR